MLKEDIITSYPSDKIPITAYVLPLTIMVLLVLILSAVLLIRKNKLSTAIAAASCITVLLTTTLIFGTYIGQYHVYQNDLVSEWYKNEFTLKYLPSVKEERFEVIELVWNENDTVSVTLESDKSIKEIKHVSNINYYTPTQKNNTNYVTAKWVDGLEEYGVLDDYYYTTLYLTKER